TARRRVGRVVRLVGDVRVLDVHVAGGAVELERGGLRVRTGVHPVEAEVGGATGGQCRVPARGARGHVRAVLRDGGVPRLASLLVPGVVPLHPPVAQGGGGVVGHGDGGGEAGAPVVDDRVVDGARGRRGGGALHQATRDEY